jgi:hypothetical protein
MALKLTLGKDDIIMMSGGHVLVVDEILGGETEVSLATRGETSAATIALDGHLNVTDSILCLVSQLYNTPNGRRVELELHAPSDIKIHRFHAADSDGKLVYLLEKFNEDDDIAGIKESIKSLLY